MRLPIQLSSLLLAVSVTTASQATIIYGNIAAATNNSGNSGNGSSILGQQTSVTGAYYGKAIGFTMGIDAYNITGLTLRLGNVTGTTDAPSISLWTNNGSNVPGAQVGTFTNPVTFNGATITDYVFTPATSMTLNASARYFIVVQQTSSFVSLATDNAFNWYFASPSSIPATGIASTTVIRLSNNTNTTNPMTFTDTSSSSVNYFQLEGTAVIPEPSSYAALAGVAVLGLVALRRRRR